ncbi:MAG: hypothetical protein ACKO55_00765 [Bacteroidota bacterium]
MAGFSFISLRWWWLCLAATGPWLIAQGQTTWDSLAVQNMDHLGESSLWPSLLDPKSPFHSSIKPWNAQHMPQELRGYRAMDSGRTYGTWAWPSLSNRSLWSYVSEGKQSGLRLDPLLNLGLGSESASSATTRQNSRGLQLLGFFGNRLRFQSSLGLHNTVYPLYLHQSIRQDSIAPGLGLARTIGQDSGGRVWDLYSSQAMLSWQVHPQLQVQWGHGKNFIGYGYRSMLLSDFAPAYTHLRLQAQSGPILYQYTVARMLDYSSPRILPLGQRIWGSEGYRQKYCSMSYLDWNLAPGLQVGLFQAIVWPAQDTMGHRGIDWNYLNPLLFMIPMQFANGSDGNALVGINTGYRWGRQQIYAQAVLDELRMKDLLQGNPTWANKFAFQAGIRGWTSVVGQGLRWQAEVNGARPFTYAHWSGATNYAHQNSALAHPMGANFVEALGSIAWFRGPWSLTLRHLIAQQGRSDSTGLNTGNNIHASYWNGADPSRSYPWLNGVPVRLQQGELSLSRLLDPLTGLRLQLTTWWRYRQSTNAWAQGQYGQRSLGFNLTLLTRLDNFYHDF